MIETKRLKVYAVSHKYERITGMLICVACCNGQVLIR